MPYAEQHPQPSCPPYNLYDARFFMPLFVLHAHEKWEMEMGTFCLMGRFPMKAHGELSPLIGYICAVATLRSLPRCSSTKALEVRLMQ